MPQRLAREGPFASTGTNSADACVAMACSGESCAPTASSEAPRRTASAATASVSAVRPEHDTAMTRSVAPTQPGSCPTAR
ncbi:hypothetical protein [Nonomuraea dietziae]|uniref:hypothetical protein n=1 Tax=Nonomuraea dietziae TaxID=65515 RepID=UPI0031E18ABD